MRPTILARAVTTALSHLHESSSAHRLRTLSWGRVISQDASDYHSCHSRTLDGFSSDPRADRPTRIERAGGACV
ncbi:hypothetical protein GY45DRAFT_1323199 [Cubamyces sp. BRFM 1775]|nr:hypothetical protein GY45DRAFT_1323199 [Cubamyces sp. BRFM 1775]